MQILRLYLGEITSLALALVLFFIAAAIASRYYNRTVVRLIRNLAIALLFAAFAASLTYSFTTNQIARGRIDRSAADQDQKAFEQRHADQSK